MQHIVASINIPVLENRLGVSVLIAYTSSVDMISKIILTP